MSTFSYFGVKHFIVYQVYYDALVMHSRTPAGRRVGYFSCVGVKLLVVYSVVHDMPNIPAGRRFCHF